MSEMTAPATPRAYLLFAGGLAILLTGAWRLDLEQRVIPARLHAAMVAPMRFVSPWSAVSNGVGTHDYLKLAITRTVGNDWYRVQDGYTPLLTAPASNPPVLCANGDERRCVSVETLRKFILGRTR